MQKQTHALRVPFVMVILILSLSPLSLNATFSVVFFTLIAVFTQISMALKVVVYLSERRDTKLNINLSPARFYICRNSYTRG